MELPRWGEREEGGRDEREREHQDAEFAAPSHQVPGAISLCFCRDFNFLKKEKKGKGKEGEESGTRKQMSVKLCHRSGVDILFIAVASVAAHVGRERGGRREESYSSATADSIWIHDLASTRSFSLFA